VSCAGEERWRLWRTWDCFIGILGNGVDSTNATTRSGPGSIRRTRYFLAI
jgi:hypothetical protein